MRPSKFTARIVLPYTKEEVYEWHLRERTFFRFFPSWEKATCLESIDWPGKQTKFSCSLERGWFKAYYLFRCQYPNHQPILRTKLEKGPFRSFDVTTELRSEGKGVELLETVEYLLHLPWFLPEYRESRVRTRFKRFFDHKHSILRKDLDLLKKIGPQKRLRILVTGANGLVGSALVSFLKAMGHEVASLLRKRGKVHNKDELIFDPLSFQGDRSLLEGFDAMVHLSGESIQGRWSRKKKEKILRSREDVTRHIVKMLTSLKEPPKVFLCASAVGFYGDCGDEVVTETHSKGEGFLADVCQAWESASSFLRTADVRVVHLRFGVVLSSKGGALRKMLSYFKLGLGAPLGKGDQYMSWIAIDDVLGAIYHALLTEELKGAVNVVSPLPVTNLEFSKALTERLYKPLLPAIPAPLLRLIFGEGADPLLLASIRATPKKLLDTGYVFRYPDLTSAFSHLVY